MPSKPALRRPRRVHSLPSKRFDFGPLSPEARAWEQEQLRALGLDNEGWNVADFCPYCSGDAHHDDERAFVAEAMLDLFADIPRPRRRHLRTEAKLRRLAAARALRVRRFTRWRLSRRASLRRNH